jgi:hypothetical protein
MTVKEFFDLCALKGCDGVVIVNELADDFTYGNVIDIIIRIPSQFTTEIRETISHTEM